MGTGTATEKAFAGKMTSEGWEVYKNGFPDFLCVKDGQVMLVEVKQSTSDKLKPHQINMLTQLTKRKPKVYVWMADNSQLIPLKEILKPLRPTAKPVRPPVKQGFKTSQEIADILGIERDTLIRRINAGVYPPPTMVKDNGLRLFSDKWLEKIDHKKEV